MEFFLPEAGWLPIDASEASKRPGERERSFGTQPPDRIHFTTGRDLRLGPGHDGPPLNYFIAPYVEVGAQPVEEGVETRFAYRERKLAEP